MTNGNINMWQRGNVALEESSKLSLTGKVAYLFGISYFSALRPSVDDGLRTSSRMK